MNVRKDRNLLRHALAAGIRTAAEMAAWLRNLDGRDRIKAGGFAQG
jgi:hypothetical protein